MFEARIEMGRHVQGLQGSKETGINNSVDSKESSEDLPAEGCKLGRLKDTKGFRFIVVVGKLGIVVHLVGNPAQYFVNVDGRGHGHRFAVAVGPSVFHPRRKAFAGAKGIQVRIGRHDGPNGAYVVVKVNGVHRYPRGAGLSWRQGNLVWWSSEKAKGVVRDTTNQSTDNTTGKAFSQIHNYKEYTVEPNNDKTRRTASLILPPAPRVRLVYECSRSRKVPLLCTMGWKVPVDVGGIVLWVLVVVFGCV